MTTMVYSVLLKLILEKFKNKNERILWIFLKYVQISQVFADLIIDLNIKY